MSLSCLKCVNLLVYVDNHPCLVVKIDRHMYGMVRAHDKPGRIAPALSLASSAVKTAWDLCTPLMVVLDDGGDLTRSAAQYRCVRACVRARERGGGHTNRMPAAAGCGDGLVSWVPFDLANGSDGRFRWLPTTGPCRLLRRSPHCPILCLTKSKVTAKQLQFCYAVSVKVVQVCDSRCWYRSLRWWFACYGVGCRCGGGGT